MKRIILLLLLAVLCSYSVAQHITNKLGTNGLFKVMNSDGTTPYFQVNSDGSVGIPYLHSEYMLNVNGKIRSSDGIISNTYSSEDTRSLTLNASFSPITFQTGGATRGTFTATDFVPKVNIIPYSNNTYTCGSATYGWQSVHSNKIESINFQNLVVATYNVENSVEIKNGSTTRMSFGSSILSTAHINPTSTETYNLGSASYKWSNLWANTINYNTLNNLSDIRAKKEIRHLTGSLEKVLKLDGVSFIYKSDLTQKRQIGFIAQEMEEIIPEVVNTSEDGYKGISYPNLVAVLVEAEKEQQEIIESQNKRIKSLEERLANLEEKYSSKFELTRSK